MVFHQRKFCTNYLKKLEPCAHFWIQLPTEIVEQFGRSRIHIPGREFGGRNHGIPCG
jgi:hypothetical protein